VKNPSAVEHRRLKYAATINDEALREETDPDFELQYVDIGNVDSSGTIHEIASYHFEDAPSRARRVVHDGDVIVSTVRTYLQAIAPIQEPPDNLIVSTGFAVVRPRASVLDPSFCKYALREQAFLREVEMRSVGVSYPAINASDLGDIRVRLPVIHQQRAIADYLYRETARLDGLVSVKERLLALLVEKRRALITRAVTRGLNPSVPLRDSGIDWIGMYPENWTIVPVKHGFGLIGSGTTPPSGDVQFYGGDVYWVTTSELRENVIFSTNQTLTPEALSEFTSLKVYPAGTVLFAMYGATIGRVAILGTPATVNQAACAMADPKLIDPWYAFYSFQASRDYLCQLATGGGQPNLNAEKVREHRLPSPPVSEQKAIVAYIERETKMIDALRSATERTISLLKERRNALITAAVTGQIEVV